MTATIHELKTIPPYWTEVASGVKTFEERLTADREFRVGDELVLREWEPLTHGDGSRSSRDGTYSGRVVHVRVTYLMSGPGMGVPAGLAVMAVTIIPGYCVCGDRLTNHHLTDAGRRTYCCSGSQAGQCPCKEAKPVGQVT